MAISSKCNSRVVPEFVEWSGFEGTDRDLEYLKEKMVFLKDKMNETLILQRNLGETNVKIRYIQEEMRYLQEKIDMSMRSKRNFLDFK